jgi:exonuclease SbcC
MKIISLHFKNLSSLKGEFKIDFSTPALANAGLFAITGPTGAGKSTILDAITLALYSYTPRLGSINKNSITEKGIIVTKHTKEAFAHLVFEVDNFKYKAEWAIAVTNRGNWGDIKHKLSKEEGGAFLSITQNTSGTVDMVNEVIGIDKDQFTKAIVLSQGKFDEFLTADEDVRYELLEVITGTDIYRKIGLKVFEALRLKNEQLKDVESQLNGIEILTAAQIEEIELTKSGLETATNVIRTQLLALNTLKQTKDKINLLIDEKGKIEADYIQLSEKEIAFQPYLVKLAEHDQALPLQVDYNKWKDAALAIQTFTASIEFNNSVLLSKQTEKKELFNSVSKTINETLKEDNFDEKLENFVKKVTKLDNAIIQINGALTSKGEALNTLYKQIPNASSTEIQPIQKSVSDLNKYIQQKDTQLSNLKLPTGFDSDDYGTEIDSLTGQNTILSKAIVMKTELDGLTESKTEQTRYLAELEKAFNSNTKELTKIGRAHV